ncbi:MAG: DNA polymerase/3'-5' exonuclease PolX [Deltaproteobacteria bacterium]
MSKNRDIADIFESIADILDILDENSFRVKAYRAAARSIQEFPEDIKSALDSGRSIKIPGVGSDLSAKIREFLDTGRIADYDELRGKIPSTLTDLLRIQGLGPKTLSRLHRELAVRDVETLALALGGERILQMKGIGTKKIEELLHGVELFRQGLVRKHLGIALQAAEDFTMQVRTLPGIEQAVICGSVRRMTETVGGVDIVASSEDTTQMVAALTQLPDVRELRLDGDAQAVLKGEIEARIRVVPRTSFGAAALSFTGSPSHYLKLQASAERLGLKLNERGLFRGDEKIAGECEEGIYRALGLSWIPPEIREDRGEIEAASAGALPRLVQLGDIRGDMHTHSNWSDGRATIEEMAHRARELGYEYIAVTDHSPSSRIANGLSLERLTQKKQALEALRGKIRGIEILMGAEVDILNDGSLDYPDEALAGLDFVVASVHSNFKMDGEAMTKRIAAALRNPYIHALGHPTGRLIGEREPYAVDMDEVIRVARDFGKALEVNSNFMRLDLKDTHAKAAIEAGVKLIISTDAHHPEQLSYMRLGVGTARRAWAGAADVVNTLEYGELARWLAAVRRG